MYKPTEEDLKWAADVIAITSEGATVGMPGCGSIYRISHKNKTLPL